MPKMREYVYVAAHPGLEQPLLRHRPSCSVFCPSSSPAAQCIMADTFKTISTKPLHPTFAAEVEGVDFSNISDETMAEILEAMAKVS